MVTEDQLKELVVCGPDVPRYLEAIGAYQAAGYDHIFIHQVGPNQGRVCDSSPRRCSLNWMGEGVESGRVTPGFQQPYRHWSLAT
jgi:hypothetical protein